MVNTVDFKKLMSKKSLKLILWVIYFPVVVLLAYIIIKSHFANFEITMWFSFIAFMNLGIWTLVWILFTLTAGQRFEKIFQDVTPEIDYIYLTMGKKAARIEDYLTLIDDFEVEKRNNSKRYRLYHCYDFLANTNDFEFLLAKLFWFSGWCSIFFIMLSVVLLWFPWEQQQTGLAHEILYWLVPTILPTGIISSISYFYLKRIVFPRIQKIMLEKQWPGHSTKLLNWDCIRLLNNYASHARRKTPSYCRLKITDFSAHVTCWECFLGKVVC